MKRTAIAAALSSLVIMAHAQVKDRAVAVQETEAVVTVTKVDREARTVTFRGPKGGVATLNVLALKVADDVKLDDLSAGDRISVTHTEALAVEMVAQAKPAAKKSK